MLLGALLTGMAASAHAETVESRIGQTEAIFIANAATPTEVTHIHLHSGNWLIGGNINVFESAEKGTVFITGGISYEVDIPADGTSPVTSMQLEHATNVIIGVTAPSRLVKVPPNGCDVYLVVFSNQPHQPAPQAYAWGSITAHLDRN